MMGKMAGATISVPEVLASKSSVQLTQSQLLLDHTENNQLYSNS